MRLEKTIRVVDVERLVIKRYSLVVSRSGSKYLIGAYRLYFLGIRELTHLDSTDTSG